MQDPLSILLSEQLKDGTWESSGCFTLDLARAASRLGKDFSSAYPRQFLLKFVQAAVAMESQSLRISARKQSIKVEMKEPQLPNLIEYFQFALERTNTLSDSTPFFTLFQGLWASLEESAAEVCISLSKDGKQRKYLCRKDSVEQVEDPKGKVGKEASLCLELELAGADLAWLKKLVRLRCAYCPIRITWNGRVVPRQAWWKARASRNEDWYKPWAPRGFRLGESYIRHSESSLRQSIYLPKVSTRGAKVEGAGHHGKVRSRWRPSSTNVLFHKGMGEGTVCGAVAQTLDNGISTPIVFVKLGVTLEADRVSMSDGGIGVLECESSGLKTDIFGLRLVRDHHVKLAKVKMEKQLRMLRRDLRTHLYPLRQKQGIHDLQMFVGAAGVLSAPFVPVSAGMTLLVGLSQLGFGWIGKSIGKKNRQEFMVELRNRFPDLSRAKVDPSRGRVRQERYQL